MRTLLNHLIPLMTHLSQRENEEALAAAGLEYVLQQHPHLLASLSLTIGRVIDPSTALVQREYHLHSNNRVNGTTDRDKGTPRVDLAITERGVSHPSIMIEAKVWATLTPNQPCEYLRHLAPGGILLFVVPNSRLALVWREIIARIEDPSSVLIHRLIDAPPAPIISAVVEREDHTEVRVAATSWLHLMEVLQQDSELHPESHSDLEQLQGLYTTWEGSSWHPLQQELFHPSTSRQLTQLIPLLLNGLHHLMGASVGSPLRLDYGTNQAGTWLTMESGEFHLEGFKCTLIIGMWDHLQLRLDIITTLEHIDEVALSLRAALPEAVIAEFRNPAKMIFVGVELNLPVEREQDEVLGVLVQQLQRAKTALNGVNVEPTVETPDHTID